MKLILKEKILLLYMNKLDKIEENKEEGKEEDGEVKDEGCF